MAHACFCLNINYIRFSDSDMSLAVTLEYTIYISLGWVINST